MPIRPENKARYPADWKAISAAVRRDAGDKCEQCGLANGALIYRGKHGDLPAMRYAADSAHCPSLCAYTGTILPGTSWDDFETNRKMVQVVLTVAHVDHTPENCDRRNLKAWCQRCHNAYDANTRARGVAERAKAARAAGDMLDLANGRADT